jgi:hypothetical protein
MENDFREKIQKCLLESYKPRKTNDGVQCSICGNTDKPMYFHAIEYSQRANLAKPTYAVTMSGSNGMIRGCFPICTSCAKPCSKCGLAMPSEKVLEKYAELSREYRSVSTGNGFCERMHFSLLLHAIYKRIFKIGRFAKNK